jgi:hypothetical protein
MHGRCGPDNRIKVIRVGGHWYLETLTEKRSKATLEQVVGVLATEGAIWYSGRTGGKYLDCYMRLVMKEEGLLGGLGRPNKRKV